MKDTEFEFNFGNKVIVTKGFYKGCVGKVVAWQAPLGSVMCYEIELEEDGRILSFQVTSLERRVVNARSK